MTYDRLKAGAKEFFIDTYVEFFQGEIVGKLQRFLAPLTPDDLRQFATEGKAPPVPGEAVDSLRGYEDYLEKLKPEEVFEWLAKARPDLADVLISLGDTGAEYVVRLQAFIIDSIRSPEGAPSTEPAKTQFVQAHCDSCGQDWPVPRELASEVNVCPFCGVGKEEEAPASEEETSEEEFE